RHIWLDESRLYFVVAQARPGIERTDVIERSLDRLNRAVDRLCNLLVLLVLQRSQVLIDNGDCVCQRLPGAVSTAVSLVLRLMIAQLIKQAFAQIAAGNTRGIKLPNDFDCFLKIIAGEAGLEGGTRAVARCGGRFHWQGWCNRWLRCSRGGGLVYRVAICAEGRVTQ